MQELDGWFRPRPIADPRSDPALAAFSSGRGKHARAVDELIRRQATGEADQDAHVVVVERDTPRGETLGVAAWRKEDLPGREPVAGERTDIYIHALGRSVEYCDHRLRGGPTVGQAVMLEALHDIARLEGENPMPLVWGFVARTNKKGQRLYEHFNFRRRLLERGLLRLLPFLPGQGDLIYSADAGRLGEILSSSEACRR